MPVVNVDPDELRELTDQRDKSEDDLLDDMFGLGLEFEGETEDGDLKVEFEPDRLDWLSIEGIARALRYYYGEDRGVAIPSTNDPEWTIEVEETPEQRPYVTGAVVRDVDLSDGVLESILQLQEKLHATMGRGRAKGAIGIHDMTMLKGAPAKDGAEKSIRYTSMSPDERFVPLESDEEMTPAEVLDAHHMGSDYADLVAGMDRYPAIYDDIGLFSFPPVINGRRTEVTEDSRDLLIEMTGTDQWTVDHMLNIVCYALSARGGRLERVEISYDEDAPGEYAGHTLDRPDLATKTKTVTHDRIETVLGVGFDEETIVDCAERSGLDVRVEENYEFEIPPYRVDVLHPVDVIDDIGRVYGFNELGPRYPDVATVGTRHERSRLEDAVRETLVGLGFEDLLNFYMTNERENFERLGVEPGTDVVGGGEPVTIIEPYSEAYTMLRTWALPSVMQVLENNTHRSYPQHLAEIGLAACVDESENTNVAEHRTVSLAMADPEASYEDVRARLQALTGRFDAELETPATEHPSFIPGRCAAVVIDGESVGVVGEVHPEVIVGHDIEVPVVAAEFRLDALQ
ncbi:phenylalanyl-tRNA synthetase beta subunit [Halovenus aranensis]|uniref:Phenylalanine--tRNA ligase beta subunit n=1 Tax=Halovenus aranensis TaxID=890420 RepID=A0A1G8XCX7_9EURY|nr:phenylalanine--tRNA ligase subunit beta [Halovenus aranensis]SDJ88321.1 phenylalanyl-tRNA synthetase beta subunit [Halovenus aranensis]